MYITTNDHSGVQAAANGKAVTVVSCHRNKDAADRRARSDGSDVVFVSSAAISPRRAPRIGDQLVLVQDGVALAPERA